MIHFEIFVSTLNFQSIGIIYNIESGHVLELHKLSSMNVFNTITINGIFSYLLTAYSNTFERKRKYCDIGLNIQWAWHKLKLNLKHNFYFISS